MITTREERMSEEFMKVHLEGLPFSAVIHHFTAPDKGGFHCHPFRFRSTILQGSYVEEVITKRRGREGYWVDRVKRLQGDSFTIEAEHIHQIVELPEGDVWTLIQPEPATRKSGFWELRDDGLYHRKWDEQEFKLQQQD